MNNTHLTREASDYTKKHTSIHKATVSLSSVSHTEILYITYHIHINDRGWSAALCHRGIL